MSDDAKNNLPNSMQSDWTEAELWIKHGVSSRTEPEAQSKNKALR
jgi:hypothetical protein